MTERRGNNRLRILKAGTIVLARGGTIRPAWYATFQKTGASIEVENSVGIPEFFDLLIGGDKDRARRCKVAWRTLHRLGVSFT